MSVKILPLAQLDLFEIWDYIATDSVAYAEKGAKEFDRIFSVLADNPEMGRRRDELKKDLRSFPSGNYVIFYTGIADGIQIIRVLHGARDIPEILEG